MGPWISQAAAHLLNVFCHSWLCKEKLAVPIPNFFFFFFPRVSQKSHRNDFPQDAPKQEKRSQEQMSQGVFGSLVHGADPTPSTVLPLEPAPSSREQQQLCRLRQRGKGAEPLGLSHCPALRGTAAGRAWRGSQKRERGSDPRDPDPIPTAGNCG